MVAPACRTEWNRLSARKDVQSERILVERFSECVVDSEVRFAYAVKDPTTGAMLTDEQMAKRHGSVRVEIALGSGWRKQELVWMARSMDSVWPLFRE